MDGNADGLNDPLALVSLFADAMASGGIGGRSGRIAANCQVLESLVDGLSELADSRQTPSGEGEAASRAFEAADLLTRLSSVAAEKDEERVDDLVAQLAGAFPLDERASKRLVGFLSLLTFDDSVDEEGSG
jgi:hypothetical protein